MSWRRPRHPLSGRHRTHSKIKTAATPAHAPVFHIAGIHIVDRDRPVDAEVAGISPVVVDGAVVEVDPEEFGVATLLRHRISSKYRSGESCKRDERRKGWCKIPVHRILLSILTDQRSLRPAWRSLEGARAIFAPGRTSVVPVTLRAFGCYGLPAKPVGSARHGKVFFMRKHVQSGNHPPP